MAQEWGIPPWEVDGIPLTSWRRYIWKMRRNVYTEQVMAKRRRERQNFEARLASKQ